MLWIHAKHTKYKKNIKRYLFFKEKKIVANRIKHKNSKHKRVFRGKYNNIYWPDDLFCGQRQYATLHRMNCRWKWHLWYSDF